MGKVKEILIGLVVVILILLGFFSLISEFLKWLFDSIKWIVFIDNAETGLPMVAEYIIKGITEAVIISIALILGISQKSPPNYNMLNYTWICSMYIYICFMQIHHYNNGIFNHDISIIDNI